MPIFTRLLGVANYGTFAVFNTWQAVIMIIVSLQVSSAIANARIKYNENEVNGYLSSILFLSTIIFESI